METVQTIFLALLQGIVEFLPISSSGHLILVPAVLGWEYQGLAFDIAVHLGTLTAVIVYFRRDLRAILTAMAGTGGPQARLGWSVIVASIPVAVAGLLFSGLIEASLRSAGAIAAATGGFGLLLWLADRSKRERFSETQLRLMPVLIIGFCQVLALIPGTSRSGITMTAGLALGLTRTAASRFSFLLAIPALGMASGWQLWQFSAGAEPVPWATLGLATAVSAVTAFSVIAVFLRVIERIGFRVFAVYRVALAVLIIYRLPLDYVTSG